MYQKSGLESDVEEIPEDNQGQPVEPEPLGRRFFNLRTAASFALGFGIFIFALTRMNVELGSIVSRLANADVRLYVVALCSYYLTFLVRAYRWRKLLRNVGYLEHGGESQPSILAVAKIILLSWFANCIVPAKLGDAYRAYLLKQRVGASWSRTLGTILAERIIDMLLLFLLLGLSVSLIAQVTQDPIVVWLFQGGLVLVVVAVVGLLSMRNLSGKIQRRVPKRFQTQYAQFEAGTLLAFGWGRMPMVMLYSLICWAIEAGRVYLVCLALGLAALNWPVILFVALAAALLTTIPFTPAGLGIVESAIVAILLLAGRSGLIAGIDEGLATSVAILDRSISYWSVIVSGAVLHLVARDR